MTALTQATLRGNRLKASNVKLRRRIHELERELKDIRGDAFAAGSASTLRSVYRALGDEGAMSLSAAMLNERGRSRLDPVIEQMVCAGTDRLLERVGLKP